MKSALLSMLFAVFMLACNNEKAADEVKKDPELTDAGKKPAPDGSTAQNSLDVVGTYKGVVPCADCEGIETSVMLHADNTYMLHTSYLGKSGGKGLDLNGNFKWIDGFTIELEGVTDAPSKYFVSENKLIQLDMQGKKIEGELADKYILTKQ
jgi:uncharacterized lipoprotein NlpE involved in copper resistance